MVYRPPFIETQRFRLLTETDNPWPFLSTDYFHQCRDQRQGRLERADEKNPWREIPHERRRDVAYDRLALPGERRREPEPVSLRRMILVTDSGTGKSANMHWLHYVLNRPESDQLAFLIDLARTTLPRVDGEPDPDVFLRKVLLPMFRRPTVNHRASLSDDMALRILRRQIAAGKLVLLWDGLDQAERPKHVCRWLRALAIDDESWKPARHILAGRPHVLEWLLEGQVLPQRDCPWRFVQVDEFTEDERETFFGRDAQGNSRYERIPEEARAIVSVPRVAQYLATKVSDQKYKSIRTPSDVYWNAIRHMVARGLKAKELAGISVDTALELLSAVAMELTSQRVRLPEGDRRRGRLGDDARVPNFHAVRGAKPLKKFLLRVFQRLKSDLYPADSFRADYGKVRKMNEILEFALADVFDRDQIRFRDRTLQEFLTAYWLSNYCSAADHRKLWDWVPVKSIPVSQEYAWVYRYTAEMPQSARHGAAWCRAIEPLFRGGDGTPEGTKRPTELMYRTWPTLERYHSRRHRAAQQVIAVFRGAGHAEALAALEPEFRRIPPPGHSLDFVYGEPAKPDQLQQPFELACYQVTNAQYEFFDPSHQDGRSDYSTNDRCPAVNVTWYDARAFCAWLGPGYRLPTEREWECACRAGTKTTWSFGEDDNGSDIDKYAWTSQNSGTGGTNHRAHPVGELSPNGFGLFDMHGNVLEWCDSLFDATVSARVLRGGSWHLVSEDSRSACRESDSPSYGCGDIGFRVVRALP